MKAVEKYIKEHTEEGSSPIIDWDGNIAIYQPWITPANAREVAQIAREETIKEVCDYIKEHREEVETEDNGISGWIPDLFVEDLKKHLSDY